MHMCVHRANLERNVCLSRRFYEQSVILKHLKRRLRGLQANLPRIKQERGLSNDVKYIINLEAQATKIFVQVQKSAAPALFYSRR
jgi:hypothetical protein